MVSSGRFAKRGWGGFVAVVLGAVAAGCSPASAPQSAVTSSDAVATEPLQVVVTTSVLCDLTQQIAQDTVDLTCLLAPGQDPHAYQARPSDRQAIDEADLVLYDGYGFARGLIGLVNASSTSAPKVAVYEVAVPQPLTGAEHNHDHQDAVGEGAHAHGDDDPEGEVHAEAEPAHGADDALADGGPPVADPHIWHRATNNAAIATVIAAQLSKVNPEQANLYDANARELAEQFAALEQWIQAQVDTIPVNNRKLVTTHDAFRYYADAYGLDVQGALSGLSADVQPPAQTLTSLVDQIKASQVPAIFAESTTNPDVIKTLANNAAVKVADRPLLVEGPSGEGTVATTTQAMLVTNTCTIVNALGGVCREASAPAEP